MASANFTKLVDYLATGAINLNTATYKCMLVTAVPSEANLDAWAVRSDVSTETTGTAYVAGGVAVTGTYAYDTANNRSSLTFTNLAPGWTGSTITAVGAIIYQNVGSAATDKLMHFVDFLGTVSSTSGTYSVTFSAPLYINR